MRILAIRGRNLASLAGDFAVDFRREPLASAGLFAICGPTGAGKSTLLDALCLALYNRTPRLAGATGQGVELPDVRGSISPQDPRNLLRRGCAEGYAEVEFVGNDGLGYRARWSVRRANQRTDGRLQAVEMSLVGLADGQPIGARKSEVLPEIEARLGLAFPQFTRAVLLAQNEFAAFLRAGDDERAQLLETLTGTDIYTFISRKAHERDREEQGKLKALQLQLEGQQPLDPAARAELEAERDAAVGLAAGLAAEKERLERHLAWWQGFESARRDEHGARESLEQAQARRDRAEPRRRHLALVEAARPAASLLAESERTARDVRGSLDAVAAAERELAGAEGTLRAAESGRDEAKRALAEALEAQRAAVPDLDRARALDVEIAAIARSHREKSEALAEAHKTWHEAEERLADQIRERENKTLESRAAADWLDRHAGLELLAEGWPRWEALLKQAESAEVEAAAGRRKLGEAEAEFERDREILDGAMAAKAATEQRLAGAETACAEAERISGGFDGWALAMERQAAEARRNGLSRAERVWRDLEQARTLRTELEARADSLEASLRATEENLREIREARPAAEAALRQAERSLAAARLACAENVEKLRAGLEPGRPCPVCGAEEHPYALEHEGLREVLDALSREAEERRRAHEDLARREAERETELRNGRSQSEELGPALERASAECGRLETAWRADPVAAEASAVSEAERAGWFTAELSAVAGRLEAILSSEEESRRAAEAREIARRNREAAREACLEAERRETAARSALDQATAVLASVGEALNRALGQRDGWLAELDTALPEPGWREAWRSNPAAFRAGRRERAEAYRSRRRSLNELDGELALLASGIQTQAMAAGQRAEERRRLDEAFRRVNQALEEKREARAGLFGGRPAAEAEAALRRAVAEAESGLVEWESRLAEARSRHDGASARLEKDRHWLAERRAAAERAERALAGWLAEFNAREPAGPILDKSRLAELLEHDAAWIEAERRELRNLDEAVGNARSVLADRGARREEIEGQQPTEEPADSLESRKAALSAEAKAADARRVELEARLRGDDARRARSAELRLDLERQEGVARLWGQLHALIGSHDGKKFRNHAQQITLDVLLRYANHHLADLSRRYRLERVPDKLALMVIDRDMADEIRSVHSLSGGESFLVSLALALGLASLSSSRVRVESLFIDEGFGSLDAETLRVAMDALDCLHAQGRKVGVISHVPEMTERIGTRIEVRRLSGGRSRVDVAG